MKTNINEITKCRGCSSQKLVDILNLGNFYLSEFYNTKKKPQKAPLDIVFCKECYLLQLKYTTPQDILYTARYGYRSGINDTMKKELKEIVNKSIKTGIPKKKRIVVDIGANDGTLLSNYPKNFYRIAVEPIKKFAKDSKKHSDIVVTDFFNYNSYLKKVGNKKADIVTIISCFYDIDNPGQFLDEILNILDDNGIIVIQQNYLVEMLRQNAFDNIVHEHLTYYSLLSFENLLDSHGLSVFDVEISPINGGSFRTYITLKGNRKISASVKKLREKEKAYKMNKLDTYLKFADRVSTIGKNINTLIAEKRSEGKTFYIYGASTRGNTLIQYFKLNNEKISKAVERNPEKWGKYISSAGIPIISEEQARNEKPDYLLVLPWFFKDEFIKRESKYLKSGGHLIFPLPTFKII